MSKKKIAVVGGGAAGITAAIAAARNGSAVTIYESNERIGKKILATGNGRCNMTNITASQSNYHGRDVSFMSYIIDTFWVSETLEFFSDIGLLYKVEEKGKVYPYSNQATSVLDVLRFELERLNVTVKYGFEVKEIYKIKGGFSLTSYNSEKDFADNVIVTTGGKAAPASGSKGGGYSLLGKFGHKTTEIFPSLVQVKLKSNELKSLNGLKITGKISVKCGKNVIKEETDEILFTDYGLSGPAVFAISRTIAEKNNSVLEIDIMPEYSFNDIVEILKKQRKVMRFTDELFVGVLHKRIGQVIIKNCTQLKMNGSIEKISDSDIKKMANKIKSYPLETCGTLSWNNAQVTAGGLDVSDFDCHTLESKKVKGIYAAGEILDIDGDCGGYNLQWAWSSGYIAGINASKEKN